MPAWVARHEKSHGANTVSLYAKRALTHEDKHITPINNVVETSIVHKINTAFKYSNMTRKLITSLICTA